MKYHDYKIKSSEASLNLVGKIKVKFLIVATFMVFMLVFAQLVFANNLAVGGQKLSEIEEQINKLKAENTTLKVEIAKESALSALSEKAQKNGFKKPREVIIPN